MDPMLLLIALTISGSVGLLIFVAYQRLGNRTLAVASPSAKDAVDMSLSSVSPLQRRRRSFPLANMFPLSRESEERMNLELERAGWPLRVREYLSLRLMSAFVGGVVGVVLMASFTPPEVLRLPIILLMVLAGWMAPRFRLSGARKKRLKQIEAQLPETLLNIAKSMQAGSGLMQALSHVGDETPAPLGPQFQRTVRELHMGAEADVVFKTLGERCGSKDVDIVVTAIVIQKTTGGNLSEILMNVANTVREREHLKQEVATLTASEQLTGTLMAIIPILVVVGFIFLNPDYKGLLFGTTIGRIALAIGITLEIIGYVLIKKLTQIEV